MPFELVQGPLDVLAAEHLEISHQEVSSLDEAALVKWSQFGIVKKVYLRQLHIILAGKQATAGVDKDSVFSLWIIHSNHSNFSNELSLQHIHLLRLEILLPFLSLTVE